MGLVCVSCGLRFYMPPGEQVWLEKHCGGSILKPGLPQYCMECMERRFSRPVSKANQTASRDGAVRMPTGEKEDVCSYAQEPIEFVGERFSTPVAVLGCDSAGIQFQILKPGRTLLNVHSP